MIALKLTDSSGVVLEASYDPDGHDSHSLLMNLTGWTGGVGVRATELPRLRHGSFPTPNDRDSRTITVDIGYEFDTRTELWDMERKVSGLFADGGYGTLEVTQDGSSLSCEVRLDGEPKTEVNLLGQWITVQIPLFAPMPYLYSPWREVTLLPTGSGVGLEYATFSKDLGKGPILTFGTAVQTESIIWNEGNAESWPQVVVTADAPGGFIFNMGGKRVSYPWPTWSDIPITLDLMGSILVGGTDQSHMLGERNWSSVPPHGNAIPSLELIQGGTGFATVRFRDTNL